MEMFRMLTFFTNWTYPSNMVKFLRVFGPAQQIKESIHAFTITTYLPGYPILRVFLSFMSHWDSSARFVLNLANESSHQK